MVEGVIAKWLKKEGDVVKSGDIIAEVETDKATMELEASEDGRIAKLIIPGGTDDLAVGTVIAIMSEAGEASDTPQPVAAAVPAATAATAAPAPAPAISAAAPVPAHAPQAPVAVTPQPVQAPLEVADQHVNATPLARRLAAIFGISLTGLNGSGAHGKVLRRDLGLAPLPVTTPLVAASAALASPPPAIDALAQAAPPPDGVPVITEKLSSMRRTIARRLSESKRTVPHFYLTARCNIDPLLRLRAQINVDLQPRGLKISVNDLLVKALAAALRQEPEANVQFGGDVIHRFARADISMAVAIDGGLITPVIRNADSLSVSAIAELSKSLAQKARDGKLPPEDYQGGTASISNLGMFGIDEMFPVINPPQGLIMGIGAGIEQPWKVDGQLGLATVMAATASFDHRAIDGAIAARFMAAFKNLVESPMALLA